MREYRATQRNPQADSPAFTDEPCEPFKTDAGDEAAINLCREQCGYLLNSVEARDHDEDPFVEIARTYDVVLYYTSWVNIGAVPATSAAEAADKATRAVYQFLYRMGATRYEDIENGLHVAGGEFSEEITYARADDRAAMVVGEDHEHPLYPNSVENVGDEGWGATPKSVAIPRDQLQATRDMLARLVREDCGGHHREADAEIAKLDQLLGQ